MQFKREVYIMAPLVFLVFSFAMISAATGVGSLTLPSAPQAARSSVQITGTSFGASKAVGIGFGAEVAVTGEVFQPAYNGLGPHKYNFTRGPIKPGTFIVHVNVNNGLSVYDITDNGSGALTTTAVSFSSGTINYATGEYATYTTVDPSLYSIVHTTSYTTYQYNVTPAAGVNTLPSGSFTTNITVPNVANGNYTVTVMDAQGNIASSTLNVGIAIPESVTI